MSAALHVRSAIFFARSFLLRKPVALCFLLLLLRPSRTSSRSGREFTLAHTRARCIEANFKRRCVAARTPLAACIRLKERLIART